MEHSIKEVDSGEEKRKSYSLLTSRNDKAIKQGFFFEAILIEYALIEDRLDSFLWAAGIINDIGEKYSFGNKRNKNQLRELYNFYYPDKKQIQLRNISEKTNVIGMLIAFAKSEYLSDDRYLIALHKSLNCIDLEGLSETLDKLDVWRVSRNEIIHGASRKKIQSLLENSEKCAKDGKAIFRKIDNESGKLAKHQEIRKAVKMPSKKFSKQKR